MDRIAVLSDIHGNIPALEAVLDDIQSKGAARIICLGDIVGKGPNSKEAVDLCRQVCDVIVKGNWDDYLSNHNEEGEVNWYRERIGSDRLHYLNNLPQVVEFYMSGRLVRLFHAHPDNLYKRIFPESPLEERLGMFSCAAGAPEQRTKQAEIVGYGDIHSVYIQNFDNKVLFNVGSVGNSLDIPLASYAIIEGRYGSREAGNYSIQFCRVQYDAELSVRQAIEAGVPKLEAYIAEVRTAVYSRHLK